MKVTYRIPSKKVPYGYIEIEDDQSYAVMPGAEELAQDYAAYILKYQGAEVAAFEKPRTVAAKAKPEEDINDTAAEEIKSQLGATEIDGDDPSAPWNEDETATKSKPAESSDSDWDF